jgi:UDP-N-acetylmuramyl pentapeptide phosphotransferase/UDP-N-acetylglucosamine-1-phosphate transferase
VHALPFAVAILAALIMAPLVLRGLADSGHVRTNYRRRELPFPFGVLSVAAALIALVPLALLQELAEADVLHPEVRTIAMYVLGVAVLGLIDDALGARDDALGTRAGALGTSAGALGTSPRGWRGHGGAVLRGELSTGMLKAAGSLGLALFALSGLGLPHGRYLLAVAVLVLATNLFNLLDLRPGRASKVFVLLGAGLTLGASDVRPLWALGLFAGPALVAGVYDLRERAMLGDTGANLLGALAGLWMVLVLSATGQAIALAVLVAITVYGEFRSISALVEKTPGLRALDSWGRPS